ncbi:MAG: FeoC-like transcriptional regulator [Acidithiobacillus sp.]
MSHLFAVRDLLRSEKMLSTQQIATRLDLSVAIVEDMLGYWQRRGQAETVHFNAASCGSGCGGGCKRCDNAQSAPAITAWHWREAPQTVGAPVTLHPRPSP